MISTKNTDISIFSQNILTGTRVNDEAWGTGELVLTDEAQASLEKQAEQLLAAL